MSENICVCVWLSEASLSLGICRHP